MDLVELKASQNKQNAHPWEQARLRFVVRQLKRLKSRLKTDKLNLLDAGCGDAYVVAGLANAFPNDSFFGYDPYFEPEVLSWLKERHRHVSNLQIDQKLDDRTTSASFNVVTLLDVIEHIEDEVAAMRELREHESTDNDTLFMITVPAYQSLFSQHDVFMKHYRRYDRELLKVRLHAAGFEVLESRYFFFSLLLPRWLKVRAEKKSGDTTQSQGVSDWKSSTLVTALVRSALVLDWQVTEFIHRLGIRLPGLSLYCICRPAAS